MISGGGGPALPSFGPGETPFVHGRTETSNTRTQTVELDPGCPGQTHTQGSGASLGNESVE